MQPITASYLISRAVEKRKEEVNAFVDSIAAAVVRAAELGYTGFLYKHSEYHIYMQDVARYMPSMITPEEILSGLKEKFTDSRVEQIDAWYIDASGTRAQKADILIEWTPEGGLRVIADGRNAVL